MRLAEKTPNTWPNNAVRYLQTVDSAERESADASVPIVPFAVLGL